MATEPAARTTPTLRRDAQNALYQRALESLPGSRDDDASRELALLLGALIASSTIHVVGEALGLPADSGTRRHNLGDNGCYMDQSAVRTLAERGRLDGEGETWLPENAEYLHSILPRE